MRRSMLVCCCLALSAGFAESRPITAEDLVRLWSYEVSVAASGRTLVAAVRGEERELAVDGAAKSVPGKNPGGFAWSPDGTRFAYFATDEGKRALFISDVGKVCTAERPNGYLAHQGASLAWSPDGQRLAFAGTLEPTPPAADPIVVTRILYKTRTALADNRRSHIIVVDASVGSTPRAITSGEFDEHSIAWGSGNAGSEIVFLSNRDMNADGRLNYDLFAVSVATGSIRQISRTPGVEMTPAVSPDGRSVAYVATTRALTTIDSVAEDAHVWVAPLSGGGAPRELNHSQDRRSGSPHWSADSSSIYFLAGDHGRTSVFRVPAAGGPVEALTPRQTQITWYHAGADGKLTTVESGTEQPAEVLREGTPLTHLNHDEAAAWDQSRPETFEFRSYDGTPVQGWIYWPKQSTGKLPLILSIHGGPHGSFGFGFNPSLQFYASRGYAALAINPRGSSGYGQRFSDGSMGNWGGGDYKDLMAGLDFVLKKYSARLDAARLGVTGSSYGGFMTNWVITQTPRFKAAVAVASLSNLISFYATSLYQDLVHAEFNGYPWDGVNFDALWRWSPLRFVKQVRTPTLFLHGENDNDVHITQAEEMYTALRQRGVEAALVRYPREGHGFTEPKHRVDAAARTIEWMDRFLKN